MPQKTPRFLCIIISFFATGILLNAQADPLELLKKFNEPEAPPAFMSIDINDTAVELFLQGSWKSFWGDYLGFGAVAGAPVSMIGFSHTPWTNSVDFLLSLWIQRHYFFETNLSDGFNFRSFSLGYASIDGPGLNKLMVANAGIDIPSYPYLTLGKAGNDVPGILAEWSTSMSRHFAMIRLLNRNTVTQYFRGTSAQLTSRTATNSFIQGRFFQLPYNNLTAIRVWVQSSSGSLASDGFRYQLLSSQDLLFMDLTRGALGLAVAATTRVLVGWDLSGSSAAVRFPDLTASTGLDPNLSVTFDSSVGQPFETNVVTQLIAKYGYPTDPTHLYASIKYPSLNAAGLVVNIFGSDADAVLVHSPGLFSIFQDDSWYSRPQGLTPTGANLDTGNDPALNTGVMSDVIHLGYIGAQGLAFRYPLLASAYADRNKLYLPGYQPGAEQFLEWQGNGTASAAGITLDQDPLPESIIVTRNGLPETGFTWNGGSKTLVFVQPVQANESISVTYDLSSRLGGSRTLQFAQGNTWNPTDGIKIEAALGLDWPIEQQASGTTGTDIGKIMTGSSINFNLPDLKLSGELAAGASLNVPGAAGARFLQDFSGGYLDIGFAAGMLVPSALPQYNLLNAIGPGFFSADTGPGVTAANLNPTSRGQLLYKSFNTGNGTMTAWNGTPQSSYGYSSGNPTGPYLAGTASGDPFSGTVAVADLVMANAANENWVAFDLRLTTDQRQALAKTGTIWFYLRADSVNFPVDIFLQAGKLAEDIDGNNQIDAGTVGSQGFIFHDSAHATTMVAGFDFTNSASNILSEDSNGNGVLDQEQNPYTRYIGNFGNSSPHTGWQLIHLSINDIDRLKLQAGNALRIIAVRAGLTGDIAGKILVGQVHLDLPGLTTTISGTGASTASATASVDRDLSRQMALAAAFPDAIRATDAAAQGRVDWTAGTGTVTVTQLVDGNSLYDNRYIRLHIQPIGLTGPVTAHLVLDDQVDAGANSVSSPAIQLSPSVNGQWLRAEFDMVGNNFNLKNSSGTVIAQGSLQITGHPHIVDHIKIILDDISSSAGTLFIDSMMANQGITSIQGKVRGKFDWNYPTPILESGGFVLLGNLRTTQAAEYSGDTRLESFPGLDEPGGSSISYAGTLGITLSYVDILVGTSLLSSKDGLSGQASYQLVFPSGIQSPIVIKDSFNADIGIALPYVQKQTGISLSWPLIADLQAQTKIIQADDILQQTWNAVLGLGDLTTIHGVSNIGLTQSSRHKLEQTEWNTRSLPEKLGAAYVWYLPGSESERLQRDFTWNLAGTLESVPAGLGLSALWNTHQDPTAIYTFSTGLDLKTSLRIGEESTGLVVTFTYLRHSIVQKSYTGFNFADEFNQGLGVIGQFSPSWKVIPFYELFDDGAGFIQDSGPYSDVLVRPQFGVGITRPLDSSWTSLVVPKQIDIGVARLLERLGNLINDRFILYGNLAWNSLNQFGKIGQTPAFQFYDTDQIDYRLNGGALLHDGQPEQWQVAPSIALALYGIAANPQLNDWRLRSASAMGLIEINPPNQAKLTESFVYRGGLRAMMANVATLDYSWYIDLPDIKYNFLNKQSKDITFLESTETLQVTTNYPTTTALTNQTVGATLTDLYGFPDSSGSDTGLTVAFRHKSYLILPGLAYLSAQLSVGYHADQVTGLGTVAVQLYIEARVVF